VNQSAKDFLIGNLDTYKAKFEPKSEIERKHRKKKKPEELKIEALRNTFTSNQPGHLVNGRELNQPDPTVRDRLEKMKAPQGDSQYSFKQTRIEGTEGGSQATTMNSFYQSGLQTTS